MHFQDVPDMPRELLDSTTRFIPGDGIAPLTRILRKLADNGYAGPLSVELFLPKFQQADPFEVARGIGHASGACDVIGRPRRAVRRNTAVVLLILTFSWTPGRGQAPRTSTTGGSRVVSPAVVATWIANSDPAGVTNLDVLVLWRGTPAWFMDARRGGSSGGGSAGTGSRRGPVVQRAFFGGLNLEVRFDPATNSAHVQNRAISLQNANVILVDEVDSATGLRIVGTVRVDPEFPSPVRVDILLRRSPELLSFLRCDIKLPDSTTQKMLDLLCAQMRGQ